jgi:hypothetical protein
MATHYHVADITTDGLQDSCDRCLELASEPLERLDDDMLVMMFDRIKAGKEPRSNVECSAFIILQQLIIDANRLYWLGCWRPVDKRDRRLVDERNADGRHPIEI